ncbi:hypothetical protein Emed_005438 [Eimeria media]
MKPMRLGLRGRLGLACMHQQQQQQQQRLYWTIPSLLSRPQPQPQQQQQQRQQQQQQQQRVLPGGPAALAAAGVAFCSVGGSRKREVRLGDVADFPEGGTYEVAVNEGKDKVLVAHLNGSFYCTAATCPHYGASLAKALAAAVAAAVAAALAGVAAALAAVAAAAVVAAAAALLLSGVAVYDHLTCPWHDAKFDVKTGKCIAGPVTQSIRTFPVSIKDSTLFANLPETFADEPLPSCCFKRPETAFKDKTFVIVGGGPAAAAAAEELRAQGFQGAATAVPSDMSACLLLFVLTLLLVVASPACLFASLCTPLLGLSECFAAAAAAAATGRLVIISKEQLPPYDRIMLSKNLKCDPANIVLRPLEFFSDTLKAELRLGEKVELIDADARTLKTDKGEVLKYDKAGGVCLSFPLGEGALLVSSVSLVWSRGFSQQTPKCLLGGLWGAGLKGGPVAGVKGSDAEGVLYVRELEDLQKFKDSIFADVNTPQSLRFVVVGSSFIGVEVAAALRKIGVREVCVVGQETVPFERALGPRIGGAFKALMEANNVNFIPEAEAQEILTRDNKVIGVKLKSGQVLAADRVVVGIGAIPIVPEIKSSKPIKPGVRGGLSVDPFLKTASYPEIFAAGDIASFPYIQSGEETRIEHYATAMDLGRSAAANMLELQKPFTALPFFWTMVFGKGLRYVGNGHGHDDVIIEGDLQKMQFVAYYTKGDKVIAVATMGKDPACVGIGEAIKLNLMPTATELRMGLKNSDDILNHLKAVSAGDGSGAFLSLSVFVSLSPLSSASWL